MKKIRLGMREREVIAAIIADCIKPTEEERRKGWRRNARKMLIAAVAAVEDSINRRSFRSGLKQPGCPVSQEKAHVDSSAVAVAAVAE